MRGRNPFEEIERFFDRMSDQFEETAEWPGTLRGDAPVDVLDRGETFEVLIDLPGFEKDDVELTLTDDALHVSAERDDEREEDVRAVREERRSGTIDRRVHLPEPVDEESAEATLADGVLRVSLEKQVVPDESKTIDIE